MPKEIDDQTSAVVVQLNWTPKDYNVSMTLNTKVRYIRKSSLGRPRLICHSPLTCAGLIQNGGQFKYSKGKVYVN